MGHPRILILAHFEVVFSEKVSSRIGQISGFKMVRGASWVHCGFWATLRVSGELNAAMLMAACDAGTGPMSIGCCGNSVQSEIPPYHPGFSFNYIHTVYVVI